MSEQDISEANGGKAVRLALAVFTRTAQGIQQALETGQDDMAMLIREYGEIPELVLWKQVFEDLEVQVRAILV
jgi:hypothetical protein